MSVLIVAFVALAHAYFNVLSPEAGPEASVESFPLKLTMELDKAVFTAGEIIPVKLSLRNLGNKIVQITYGSRGSVPEGGKKDRVFGVLLQVNETLTYRIRSGGISFIPWTYSLDPNEEVKVTFLWDQKVVKLDFQLIPPGTYSLIATLPPGGPPEGGWMEIDGVGVRGVRTPPLTITINSG